MMNLPSFRDRTDPALHVQNLLALQALYNYQTFSQISAALPGWFTGTEQFLFSPATPTMPNFCVIGDGTTNLIILGGATLLSQFVSQVNSWNIDTVRDGRQGFNPLYANAAGNLVSIMNNPPFAGSSFIRVIGFSMGGAIALAFWQIFYNPGIGSEVTMASYAAPRSCHVYDTGMSRSHLAVRVFSNDDVVPNLPPTTAEGPSFHLLLPRKISQGANTQMQPCNGIAIDSAGNTLVAYQSPMAISPVQGALPQWLMGVNAAGSNQHSILTYLGRWQRANRPGAAGPPDIPGSRLPGAGVNSPRVIRAAERAAVVAAAALGASNPAAQIALSTPNLVISKTVRFTRYTSKGVRYVAYGDTLVAVCTSKREQRQLVRAYNRWWKDNLPI